MAPEMTREELAGEYVRFRRQWLAATMARAVLGGIVQAGTVALIEKQLAEKGQP